MHMCGGSIVKKMSACAKGLHFNRRLENVQRLSSKLVTVYGSHTQDDAKLCVWVYGWLCLWVDRHLGNACTPCVMYPLPKPGLTKSSVLQQLQKGPASFSHFRARYWTLWANFLRFRKASEHAMCDTCFELLQVAQPPSATKHLSVLLS